jgi:hypothetical protein
MSHHIYHDSPIQSQRFPENSLVYSYIMFLNPLFSLPLWSLSSPPSPSVPRPLFTQSVLPSIQAVHCTATVSCVFASCLFCLSYLLGFCLSQMNAEAMLCTSFDYYQCWTHGMHRVVHQRLDELFRYLLLHFQVLKTIKLTVLWLNPRVLIIELPKHD